MAAQEGSSSSLTLCGGGRRPRAWAARGSLAAGSPRSASGVSKSGFPEHGSGVRLGVVSPRRKKERAGGCAPPPASQGWLGCPSSPPHPEVFLGVKTSETPLKPSRAGDSAPLCPTETLPHPSKFWTRPWDLPLRTFKSLESEIHGL